MRFDDRPSAALTSVLDSATAVLIEEASGDDRPTTIIEPADDLLADPTEPLVQAGWFVLQQLRVALGFARSVGDAGRIVRDVLERARRFGGASPEAIGAAAALVDHVRCDDSIALARDIMAARAVLGDRQILAGAAALIAAFSTEIAVTLDLDPLDVHRELASFAGRLPTCRVHRGRIRSRRRRTSGCSRPMTRY